MIDVQYLTNEPNDHHFVGRIVMRPNQSFAWYHCVFFLLGLSCISLLVAITMALLGFWMILPFSVIELSVIAGSFYYLAHRSTYQEVLSFSTDELVLESGKKSPSTIVKWQRYFAKIEVEQPQHPWYPKRVFVKHKHQRIEIGSFLNSQDKQDLLTNVQELIDRCNHCQANKPS